MSSYTEPRRMCFRGPHGDRRAQAQAPGACLLVRGSGAVDRFYVKQGRYPGLDEASLAADASLLADELRAFVQEAGAAEAMNEAPRPTRTPKNYRASALRNCTPSRRSWVASHPKKPSRSSRGSTSPWTTPTSSTGLPASGRRRSLRRLFNRRPRNMLGAFAAAIAAAARAPARVGGCAPPPGPRRARRAGRPRWRARLGALAAAAAADRGALDGRARRRCGGARRRLKLLPLGRHIVALAAAPAIWRRRALAPWRTALVATAQPRCHP